MHLVLGNCERRGGKKIGRVAIKALIYFEEVTTIGLVLGMVLVNLWTPGAGMHVDLKTLALVA